MFIRLQNEMCKTCVLPGKMCKQSGLNMKIHDGASGRTKGTGMQFVSQLRF